jgi:hypothetical protein
MSGDTPVWYSQLQVEHQEGADVPWQVPLGRSAVHSLRSVLKRANSFCTLGTAECQSNWLRLRLFDTVPPQAQVGGATPRYEGELPLLHSTGDQFGIDKRLWTPF